MGAQLLLHSKQMQGDEIVEIKIWDVPKSADRPHGIKISLVYVKGGKRMLGYDNAEGKGYHRHMSGREEPYHFADIWKLLADFKKDLKRLRGRDWNEN
jgi:hypothetical protein